MNLVRCSSLNTTSQIEYLLINRLVKLKRQVICHPPPYTHSIQWGQVLKNCYTHSCQKGKKRNIQRIHWSMVVLKSSWAKVGYSLILSCLFCPLSLPSFCCDMYHVFTAKQLSQFPSFQYSSEVQKPLLFPYCLYPPEFKLAIYNSAYITLLKTLWVSRESSWDSLH